MMNGESLFSDTSAEPFVKRSPDASISCSTEAEAAKSGLRVGQIFCAWRTTVGDAPISDVHVPQYRECVAAKLHLLEE